jgi:genome maintenance exonuclease 1
MAFTHLNTIVPLNLKSIDGPKGRVYTTPEGMKYPSITTVLGSGEKPWLRDWRAALGPVKADKEMKRAADRGTAVHLMLERYLNNDPDPTYGQHIDHINEFTPLKMHVRSIDNILLQEAALYSDELQVAGRVDLIAEYKGKLAVIDWKTSTRAKTPEMIQNYYLQTTAYALMVDELYNITIDDIFILMSVERGSLPLIFKGKVENYIEPLLECLYKYHHK